MKDAPQPLKDIATLLLDTGLRVGEGLSLAWKDIDFRKSHDARNGWVNIRQGKSRAANSSIPLTNRARVMLEARLRAVEDSEWVFPDDTGLHPVSRFTVRDQHAARRKAMGLEGADFVIHSLRHTCLTRLGENKVDVFTLRTLAGHSSVVVTQRYVSTSDAAKGLAIRSLEVSPKPLPQATPKALPATIPATPAGVDVDAVLQPA